MSDARLRELERRWKETNSPDDEAAYLLERVRVGDLTRERLELAAYLGNAGSRAVVGQRARQVPTDILRWVEQLDAFGADVALRAEQVRSDARDETHLQEWFLHINPDGIADRVRRTYAAHMLPWALRSTAEEPCDRRPQLIRDLEATWRASRSTMDEIAYLRARLAGRHLSEESVQLAAFTGHPAAIQILGLENAVEFAAYTAGFQGVRVMLGEAVLPADFSPWLKALVRWNKPTCSKTWQSLALILAEPYAQRCGDLVPINSALKALERWLDAGVSPSAAEIQRRVGEGEQLRVGEMGALGDDPIYRATWMSILNAMLRRAEGAEVDAFLAAICSADCGLDIASLRGHLQDWALR